MYLFRLSESVGTGRRGKDFWLSGGKMRKVTSAVRYKEAIREGEQTDIWEKPTKRLWLTPSPSIHGEHPGLLSGRPKVGRWYEQA